MKKFDVEKLDKITKDFINTLDEKDFSKEIAETFNSEMELIKIDYNYESYDSTLTIKEIKNKISELENKNSKIEQYNSMLPYQREDYLKEVFSNLTLDYLEYIQPLVKLTKKEISKIEDELRGKRINLKNVSPSKYVKYIKNEIVTLRKLSISNIKKMDDSKYTKAIQKVNKKKNKEQPPLVQKKKTESDFTKSVPKTVDDLLKLNPELENHTYAQLKKLIEQDYKKAKAEYTRYAKEIESANSKNIKYRKKIYHDFMDILVDELNIDKKELSRLSNILQPSLKGNLFSYDKKLSENSVSKEFRVFILRLKETFN